VRSGVQRCSSNSLLSRASQSYTTVIVAQSPTSNHSVFKEKCFIIENNGKILSENNQEQIMGTFHCLEVHIKVMTIKKGSQHSKPAQQVKPIIFSQVKVLCEKRSFSVFQIKIKALSHTGGNKIYSQS